MTDSRQFAFSVLSRIEKDKAYANVILSELFGDAQSCTDIAFANALVKGVLERMLSVDLILSKYLSQPLKRLKPQVLTIMRLGAYQIVYMDRVPKSAAVNESVKLAKKNGCSFACGLINAVLRKIEKSDSDFSYIDDKINFLSAEYSFPDNICRILSDYYGVDIAEKILASSLGRQNIFARYNTLKNGILRTNVSAVDVCKDAVLMPASSANSGNEDINDGYLYIQDLSSQLCCKALDLTPGLTMIDVCSAPGGKSVTAAQYMQNIGRIISCDIYPHKLTLIEKNAQRNGIDIIETCLRDASDSNAVLPVEADRILCDVPCSGWGVTGKKPEIKYKDFSNLDSLYDIQYTILENSSKYLKRNGKLIYSTCTLNPMENAEICRKFLSRHNEFILCDILEDVDGFRDMKTLTVLPYIYGCDGFFIACFERLQ